MITFRAYVKTDEHRTRDQIPPGFKHEVKRMSKGAAGEPRISFLRLLAAHFPCGEHAVARLERTDSRGYTTLVAAYSGRVTKCDPTSGKALAGVWTLERQEQDRFGITVDGQLPHTIGGAP